MIYELALISVVIAAGYWGWFFLRHSPTTTLTFGAMQLGAAVLAGLGLLGRHVDAGWLGVAGAIGAGAGACLLVIGPLVRVAARRLVADERPRLAGRLFDLAEILVPGAGIAEEKALVRAMTEIREGRIEQTVDALTAAKDRAPPEARLAIDERITMLYLTAYRWADAIAHAEAHLFAAPATHNVEGSLRQALGFAPPVWVELLGAYGRVGDLEHAARMLAKLEDVCAGRDDAALWIHRSRVMFLALAGRLDAVRALVVARRSRHMTRAARAYWVAVALEHRGDRAAAVTAYRKARGRSHGRPRELIDLALARLSGTAPAPAAAGAPAALAPVALAPVALEVVARVEAAPLPALVPVPRRIGSRATWLLTGVLVAVWTSVALGIGETSDIGVLTRAGALVHAMIAGGEWWRLIACLFLHVGTVHFLLNALGLVVLGRLAEEMFGSARTIAVFGAAGIAGSLASYVASPVGISAGASGAVFGLLGAVFVEITWHRDRYLVAWKRGMWGALAAITVGQLGYGFLYPAIDQWAHAAGLVAGAAFGAALSPHAKWARAGLYLGRAMALGFGVFAITAAVLVIGTPLVTSLTRGGTARRIADGVAITVPASWLSTPPTTIDGKPEPAHVLQPEELVVVKLARMARGDPASQLAVWIAEEGQRSAKEIGELRMVHDPIVALPAGWDGRELAALGPEDDLGYRQRMRVILCDRAFADTTIVMAIQVPETVASAAPGFVAGLIASTAPASP
ncbi:MAG TPA: rhomboid family intramembrane serine protease [Kofleriaceae bacterium]|nr:rhomboid family intramembrane serine protease [Kofleriaceae bacterium]